jgi:hypothetical protein
LSEKKPRGTCLLRLGKAEIIHSLFPDCPLSGGLSPGPRHDDRPPVGRCRPRGGGSSPGAARRWSFTRSPA